MREIIKALFLLLLFSNQANARTHCLCELGDDPKEKAFYSMGCDLWFNKQQCNTISKIDRSKDQTIPNSIDHLMNGDTLKVAYVGHWYDSYQTLDYIDRYFLPLVSSKRLKIIFDNTACSPMENPELVQDYLMNIKMNWQSSIDVMGSQSISIGLWDDLYSGKANFYAYASTDWQTAKFWPCSYIENSKCAGKYQAGEWGRCYDKLEKKLVELQCRKQNKSFTWLR